MHISKTLRNDTLMSVLGVLTLLLMLPNTACSSARSLHQTKGVRRFEWNVTLSSTFRPPDCFTPAKTPRKVILVNGEFEPTLTVTQGDLISINVTNNLPTEYNAIMGGISIHWHGFNMRNNQWLDGMSYVTQCPIAQGGSFTYAWKIDEPPGTYFWHDHALAAKADGLKGALIVLPANGTKEPFDYDDEHMMFLSDWFWASGPQQAVEIQRPFDANKSTADSGLFWWVGLPQSMLFNGKGIWKDCNLTGNLGRFAGQANVSATCDPVDSAETVTGETCPREEFVVETNKTYRFRIIGGASLVYMTVCFGGHDVTVVAFDSVPVKPFNASCVDINSGQRLDVLLTANQPSGAYWITILPQFRKGAPAGYAVLRYKGSKQARPDGPVLQPNGTVLPWDRNFTLTKVRVHDQVLKGGNSSAIGWKAGVEVPQEADMVFSINNTQPLYEPTGQMRWALNNIAHFENPPCEPIMLTIKNSPEWLEQNSVPISNITPAQSLLSSPGKGSRSEYNTGLKFVFLDGTATDSSKDLSKNFPIKPTPGFHVVELGGQKVVDVIVQNNGGNSFGGDYRQTEDAKNRTGQEQHPFHLHGHHFWVIATGDYTYNASNVTLNLKDPSLQDTLTLYPKTWFRIRFLTDNPGLWPLHCHIWPHMAMGQMLYFSVGSPASRPPRNLTDSCPSIRGTCRSSFTALSNTTGPATDIIYVRPDDAGQNASTITNSTVLGRPLPNINGTNTTANGTGNGTDTSAGSGPNRVPPVVGVLLVLLATVVLF